MRAVAPHSGEEMNHLLVQPIPLLGLCSQKSESGLCILKLKERGPLNSPPLIFAHKQPPPLR